MYLAGLNDFYSDCLSWGYIGHCVSRECCEEIRKTNPGYVGDCTTYPQTCAGGPVRGAPSTPTTISAASACAQAGGSCIDIRSQSCSKQVEYGLCPGDSNHLCCKGAVTSVGGGPTPVPGPPGGGAGGGGVPSGTTFAAFPWWGWLLIAGGAAYAYDNFK